MDSRDELLRRRTRATASDQVPGMFFSGLLGLIERDGGPERAAKIRAERRFPKRVLSFLRYPAADFLDVVDGIALELSALEKRAYDAALVRVGGGMIQTFMEGPVGKTMLSMLGGDAHRMMSGASTAYATTFSFGKRQYVKRSAQTGEFICRGELLGPQVTRGVLQVGLELSCPVVVATRIDAQTDSENFTVALSWEPRSATTAAASAR